MSVNKPGIVELSKKVDCRYTLVGETSKRARELVNVVAHRAREIAAEAEATGEPLDEKPVSIAIEEINRGLLTYRRNLEDEEQ